MSSIDDFLKFDPSKLAHNGSVMKALSGIPNDPSKVYPLIDKSLDHVNKHIEHMLTVHPVRLISAANEFYESVVRRVGPDDESLTKNIGDVEDDFHRSLLLSFIEHGSKLHGFDPVLFPDLSSVEGKTLEEKIANLDIKTVKDHNLNLASAYDDLRAADYKKGEGIAYLLQLIDQNKEAKLGSIFTSLHGELMSFAKNKPRIEAGKLQNHVIRLFDPSHLAGYIVNKVDEVKAPYIVHNKVLLAHKLRENPADFYKIHQAVFFGKGFDEKDSPENYGLQMLKPEEHYSNIKKSLGED